MEADMLQAAQTKGLHTFFKLQTTISYKNFYLFDGDGDFKKYNSDEEILNDFYKLRLKYYEKRKQYLEGKKSIIQTFWKIHIYTDFLFFWVRDFKLWLLA